MPASTNVGPSKPRPAPVPRSDAASGGGYAPSPKPRIPGKTQYYTTKAQAQAAMGGRGVGLKFQTGKGYYLDTSAAPKAPGAPPTPNQAAAAAAANSNSSLQQYLSYLQSNMGRTASDIVNQQISGIQAGYLAQQKQGSQAIVGDTQTYVNELGKIGAQADQAYTTAETQQSALDTAIGSALSTGDVGASASKLTQALAAAGQDTAPGAAAQAAANSTGASQYASASASLSQLFAQGAAQSAYDKTLPGIAKAQGLNALGAFNASLTSAEAQAVQAAQDKLPALMNAFTSQSRAQTAAAAETFKENQPKIYGSSSSGYFAILPNGKNVQLTAPGAPKPIVRSDGQGGLVQVNPGTGKVTQLTPDKPTSPKAPTTRSVGGVLYQYDPASGKWVKAAGTPRGAKGGAGSTLSPNEATSYVKSLVKEPTASQAAKGIKASYTANYLTAYKHLRQSGMGDVPARTLLDSYYPKGAGGRAWITNEQQAALAKAKSAYTQKGYVGLKSNHAAVADLTTVHKYKGLGYLTAAQLQILRKSGQAPKVESGAPNGGYWIDPRG